MCTPFQHPEIVMDYPENVIFSRPTLAQTALVNQALRSRRHTLAHVHR